MPTSFNKCMDCKQERSIAFETVKQAQKEKKIWFITWLITFIILMAIISGIVYIITTSDIKVVEQNGQGVNNYIGDDGDINNGTTSNNDKTEEPEQSKAENNYSQS